MAHFHRTATAAQLTDEDDEGVALASFRARPLDPGNLLPRGDEIVVAIAADGESDPSGLPDAALAAHVERHHHAYVRRAVPYVVPLLARVVGASGKRNPKLRLLCEVGEDLAEALDTHVDADAWRLLAGGDGWREALPGELERLICYHAKLALLLARVRSLADGFVAPDWADRTYRTLMEELEALEENVLQGLRLEKCVLIPRLSWRSAAS